MLRMMLPMPGGQGTSLLQTMQAKEVVANMICPRCHWYPGEERANTAQRMLTGVAVGSSGLWVWICQDLSPRHGQQPTR